MHRQDKIAIALCVASAAMGVFKPWVPEGWPSVLFYIVWLLPMLWFVPKIWRSVTPRCSLKQWWQMRRLGYTWMMGSHQFIRSDPEAIETFFVSWHSQAQPGWSWFRMYEIGTDGYQHRGGPCTDPMAAHVLGCLQNWRSE